VNIILPPLRQRLGDIPLLADSFLNTLTPVKNGLPGTEIQFPVEKA